MAMHCLSVAFILCFPKSVVLFVANNYNFRLYSAHGSLFSLDFFFLPSYYCYKS